MDYYLSNFSDYFEQFENVSVTNNYMSYALGILMIVARWFIFNKAGEEGWASLIPYYNKYVLYKVSEKKNLFWGWLACNIVGIVSVIGFTVSLVIMLIGDLSMNSLMAGNGDKEVVVFVFLMIASGIATFVLNILQNIGLSEAFGLSGGWAAGLIFLPHIFYSILAFDKKYQFTKNTNATAAPVYGAPYGSPYENPYATSVNPTDAVPPYGMPEDSTDAVPPYAMPGTPGDDEEN